MTKDMLKYLAMFTQKELTKALVKYHALTPGKDRSYFKGISKTVAALWILEIVIEDDLSFEELKTILKKIER